MIIKDVLCSHTGCTLHNSRATIPIVYKMSAIPQTYIGLWPIPMIKIIHLIVIKHYVEYFYVEDLI